MKYTFWTIIAILTLQSCRKSNSDEIYNLDTKPRDVILKGNEKHIQNPQALEFFENGLANVDSKDYIKAQEYFLKANEIENNNVIILNCIANIESALGNNKKSIDMLYKNISIDSTEISTYSNLGQNLMIEKKYEEANKILLLGLEKGIKTNLHQKSILLLNLAISFNNLQQCDEGLEYANQALKISQNKEFSKLANQIIEDSNSCN